MDAPRAGSAVRISYSGCRPPPPGSSPTLFALFDRIVADVIADVATIPEGTVVVHGNAEGVDAAARDAARRRGLPDEPWLPDPGAHGGDFRKALLARNAYVDTVGPDGEARLWVAPWSRGTWDAWRKAERAGVPRHLREYLLDGTVRETRWPPAPSRAALAPVPVAPAPGHRLQVFTARISSRDPDRLDVTRRSAGPDGLPFAPSAGLLAMGKSGRLPFLDYDLAYRAEMRVCYGIPPWRWTALEQEAHKRGVRPNRATWDAILARPRVVAACYCTDPEACHRSLLADIWGKLGADVRGEVGLAEAVAAVRAGIERSGKLTTRDLVAAVDAAGAELCVVWGALYRAQIVEHPYEVMKHRGLLEAVRKLRAGKV